MLYNLQVARVFAIYLVVLFHFGALTALAGLPPLRYGGVDLLLMITGFLAMRITVGKAVNPLRFFAERIARVAPLYWIVTLAAFALALIAPHFFQATRANPAELAQSLFFIPFAKQNGLVQPLIYIGWTLNYQVAFYALFALGLLARPRELGTAFVALVLVGLAVAGATMTLSGIDERFYTGSIILYFLVGMAIALFFSRLAPATPNRAQVVLSTLCIGVALALYVWGGLGGAHAYRMFSKGVPGALLLIGLLELERHGIALRSRAINYCAKATYSIFLTHIFVTGAALHAAQHFGFHGAAAFGVLILGLIAVTVVGCLTYEFIEKPINKLTRSLIAACARHSQGVAFERLLRPRPKAP